MFRSLFIDYRHFDAENIEPRFEFGFGLSYTEFGYSGLHVAEVTNTSANATLVANWKAGKPSPNGEQLSKLGNAEDSEQV